MRLPSLRRKHAGDQVTSINDAKAVFAELASFDPNFGFTLLLPVFAAVVLGGIGSAYGALAGGLVLGLAMELSTWPSLLGGVNPVYKPVVAFLVLAGALMVRPQGLFGRAKVV
jgi:branched-subunit amino acid ABC-type transport system permease component